MREVPWRTSFHFFRVPLIVTFHPGLPPLKHILEKHSSILNVSERMRQAVRNSPLVAYRRQHNLRSLLVRAMFKQQQQTSYRGNSQCQQPRCKTCHHMKTVNKFKSSATAKCGLRDRMYKMQENVCWRNGECAPHTNEWPSVGY